MINRNRTIVWLALIALFEAVLIPPIHARIWTSRSGATVEAELLKVEGGFVQLESAEGKRFKIRQADLSEEDRQHVAERQSGEGVQQLTEAQIAAQFGVDPNEKDKGPAEANIATVEGQGTQDKIEADPAHFLSAENFAEASVMKAADFPDLKLENPEKAAFIGLQYGPEAKDVVYVAFDRESSAELPETALIHNMGNARMNIHTYKRAGKKGDFEKEEDKDYRVVKFEDIELASSFGEIKVKAELKLIFGIVNPGIIHGFAEIELRKGFQKCDFLLVRDLSDNITTGSGEIETVHLLGPPSVNVRVLWNNVYGTLKFGEWMTVPGRGMDGEVELAILGDEAKELESSDVEWEEEAMVANNREEWKWYDPEEFDEPGNYKVRATIDLGPILGTVSNEVAHTVKK